MNNLESLKNNITDLFRSAIGNGYTEEQIEEMLEGIDFCALAQSAVHNAETVYEYAVNCVLPLAMNYRGPELFPRAVLLYEEIADCMMSLVCCFRSFELWLLEDGSLVVVTNFQTDVLDGEFTTEYRAYKSDNWQECGMEIDMEELVQHLNEICRAYHEHTQPICEL